jgi:hypothetical protein
LDNKKDELVKRWVAQMEAWKERLLVELMGVTGAAKWDWKD